MISGSSAFLKSTFKKYIWKFSVHILLKPSFKNLSSTLLAYEMNATGQSFAPSFALPFFGTEMIVDLFQISFIKNILFFIKNIYYYKNNNLFLFGCAGSSGL